MKYDPDKRRVPVHLHFSRQIAKEAQEKQEWIIVLREYLVAIGNLVEQIAVATKIDFEIFPDWNGNTITLSHLHLPQDSIGNVISALQMIDTYCNQQLRYKLDPSGAWTAMANLPANLGNNAFHIRVIDCHMQLGSLIPERTAKEAQP